MAEPSLPTKKLEGKVAIVTGGASGIGEATAHLFAQHGARAVVIADIQDDKGRLVAESIGQGRSAYVHCDVTDEGQVKSMVDRTVQTYGRLDVMFSNAGIVSRSEQTLLDLDFGQFDLLFAINVRGMAACVKEAARAMVEGGLRGSIVCTASVVARKGGKRSTDYVMSKHAVAGLVRAASQQLGEHGIRVNSVSPFAVATPLNCQMLGMEAAEVEKVYEPYSHLKGVVLKVGHVADAVLFLASEDSAFITGHDIAIDGGFLT
ncbi:(-)-isopiperitenol/(-)-carveol dehydrogenase [Actinidia chinensis var. chinensis]|uniref:(-)-isopiperitenol/(-)-carveol dehydrogenase n=1 Tax=Actinidia chinensis var. chinensis TaxID=1590841 RepID=A0A2R6QGY1_ACTCC|nr:(-)-isopiperitenol/(-)-carveol dehydrogenase [Actinidia chinensis var. chinensis]